MTHIGKFSSFPPLSPPLIVYQSAGGILGIRRSQHAFSCSASHGRVPRPRNPGGLLAWQGADFVPRCIPRSRGFSQPHAPEGRRLCLCDTTKGPPCPCGTQTKALRPWNLTEGRCPSAPLRGGWAESRAAGVPPEPDQRGFRAPWTHDQEYPSWAWTSSLLDRPRARAAPGPGRPLRCMPT